MLFSCLNTGNHWITVVLNVNHCSFIGNFDSYSIVEDGTRAFNFKEGQKGQLEKLVRIIQDVSAISNVADSAEDVKPEILRLIREPSSNLP